MIRVLIVGTGGMAHDHAKAYAAMDGVKIVAGIDTNPDNLEAFQKTFDIPHGFASVEDALAWGDFDAVSTRLKMHCQWQRPPRPLVLSTWSTLPIAMSPP